MIELTKKRMLDLAQTGARAKSNTYNQKNITISQSNTEWHHFGGVNVGKANALVVTTPQTKTERKIFMTNNAIFVSPLTAFRENSKQFNNALKEGRTRKASIVEFTDITGKVSKRYWNGATYTDRSNSLFEKEFKGTYKVSFKKPMYNGKDKDGNIIIRYERQVKQ